MAQKPYRFSKKAGRYIPNTQSGNREFYHNLLASIEPLADFDPNSTYGKHIMNKTISDLRKYKQTIKQFRQLKNSLTSQLRSLTDLQSDNKREESFRRKNAINERASEIAQQKNPLIAFVKNKSFFFAIVLSVLSYLIQNDFHLSFWVFFGSWLTISILANWIFSQIRKSNLTQAEYELNNKDFCQDLRIKGFKKQVEIDQTKIEIENCKKELDILESEIRLKVKDLLKDEKLKFILSEQFYNSTDWKKIREQALSTYEKACVKCGSFDNLAVDHIHPRSKFPEKALELSNTQILCLKCNSSKGNRL